MAIACSELVGLEVTRYYHCISRCVWRALLCGEGFERRKQLIDDRIELLAAEKVSGTCQKPLIGTTGMDVARTRDVLLIAYSVFLLPDKKFV